MSYGICGLCALTRGDVYELDIGFGKFKKWVNSGIPKKLRQLGTCSRLHMAQKLTIRRITVLIGSCVLLPAVGAAMFSPFVIDVVQEYHSAVQIAKEIEQLHQGRITYEEIVKMYTQLAHDAQFLGIKNRWLGIGSLPVSSTTPTSFGETGSWNEAVNVGVNIPGAYGQATNALTPSTLYSAYRAGRSLMSANMASVNIADGAIPAAIMSIAQSRGNQPKNDLALSQLEETSQDESDKTNSAVEQLNLANGGIVLLNRQLEDLTAVATSQAEQQIVGNKQNRDNVADAVNFYSQMDDTVNGQATAWGQSSQTVSNW